MLEECREMYQHSAENLPNYKKLSQIELVEGYLSGGPNAEYYLSALILRYWNIPMKLINRDKGLYDEKEAYNWYINSLLYTLDSKAWKDKNSTVYNDPRAIEKMLNTCVKCDRANWFQASNRHKRCINHGLRSLDTLTEDYNDAYVPIELIADAPEYAYYSELVTYYFNRKQYLMALVIDVIVNDVKLENVTNDISLVQAVKKSIRSLPEDYAQIFSETYDIPLEKVEISFQYIYNMKEQKLKQSVEDYVHILKTVLSRG